MGVGHRACRVAGAMTGASFWDAGVDFADPTTAETIRDLGRWEVVVAGTPPEAVTNDAETDWLYYWVED